MFNKNELFLCAFLIYFPSYSLFHSKSRKLFSACSAGAGEEDTEGTTTLFPVHSQLSFYAPHTRWARELPFTLFYAEILPFFPVFKLTFLISMRSRDVD